MLKLLIFISRNADKPRQHDRNPAQHAHTPNSNCRQCRDLTFDVQL
ncbi:Uncharacterised protein [Vibrio cholerae]|nr:Uncharacterised protein [Vibrio cholerae]